MYHELIFIYKYYKVQRVWVSYSRINPSLTPTIHTFYRLGNTQGDT